MLTIDRHPNGAISVVGLDNTLTVYIGLNNVTITEVVEPTGTNIKIISDCGRLNIGIRVGEELIINNTDYTSSSSQDILTALVEDVFYNLGGGGGGGVEAFLDPLFFSGTGTEDDPIVPLGWRDSLGRARTTDGDDNIIPLLLTPNAPTNPITDVENKLFSWTNNPQYPNPEDYEYSIDNGVTWSTVESNPLEVPNTDITVGYLQVRIAAVEDVQNHSNSISNDEAYVATLQEIDLWPLQQTGNTNVGNTIYAEGTLFAEAVSSFKILEGTSGWVQFDVNEDASGYENGSSIVLQPGYSYAGAPNNLSNGGYCYYSNANNKPGGRLRGVWMDNPPVMSAGTTKMRIGVEDDIIYIKASEDNWVTEVVLQTGERPAGDIYIKNVNEALPGRILNIVGLGLVEFDPDNE